jgi:hypothetical protein
LPAQELCLPFQTQKVSESVCVFLMTSSDRKKLTFEVILSFFGQSICEIQIITSPRICFAMYKSNRLFEEEEREERRRREEEERQRREEEAERRRREERQREEEHLREQERRREREEKEELERLAAERRRAEEACLRRSQWR